MQIIYGPKGTGKTKAIIDKANLALNEAKGNVLFVTDTKRYTINLNHNIKFIDSTDFNIQGADGFRGFIKGLVAASGDNEYIFIDGIARITGKKLNELSNIFGAIEKLEEDYKVKFVLTCSASKEELPEFILKYAE